MHNTIGISTGSLFGITEDVNNAIDMLRKAGTDAIELLFADLDELSQDITQENRAYLKGLSYVAIHAPFNKKKKLPLSYEDNEVTQKVIDRLATISKQVGAQAIVVHPNLVKDWDILARSGLPICVENMPAKRNLPLDFFTELMRKYPDFGLILDTAHALTWENDFLNGFIEEFNDRIAHVHLSDRRYEEGRTRNHKPMAGCSDPSRFERVWSLNCPLMSEIQLDNATQPVKTLKEEIDAIRAFLG